MVNANYAIPGENLGIKSVRERYFLGPYWTTGDYREVIDGYPEKKESIPEPVDGFDFLSDKDRQEVSNYLNEFFVSSNQDGYIERYILSTCR